ncbi:putative pre-16S rRNA nuclease [Thiohalobacter sp. COW1]|uniref:Putative pre-16S rRNA nuclease n=1 Tax=Thiohalobacter thiocyanaticus TaxID=585455 RepID=A0A1Z4VUQ2_9GAMM|nr:MULTISPECIES: Holliday junction resolvase RuvX [Thiohalobacter]BAZ95369.1 endonuclease [Thiohalobacter thiocyanaticus]BCO32681.1 putative pre-16S rRNA nuclease [Thiohalobacter sp. COW1]
MPEAAAATLLGFDHGRKKIGVAVGQTVTGTARALQSLPARDGQPDWGRVAALLDEWRPQALVVGRPLYLTGDTSATTAAAERFARRLHGRFGLPVHLMDERLSSQAARRLETGNDADIDAQSARIILQDWLDEHKEH